MPNKAGITDAATLPKETPNKSRRAPAGSFSVMPRQMPFDVAMLRLHAIFLA